MHAVAVAVSIAALTLGRPANALDYPALVQELRALKNDPDVVTYLADNLRASRILDRGEQEIRSSLRLAREYEDQAQEMRRQRADALALQAVTGGYRAAPAIGEMMAKQDNAPEVLELKAAEYIEAARDSLVELVAEYREVKAVAGGSETGGGTLTRR
jgi:predicted RNA-binding protein with PIN domain